MTENEYNMTFKNLHYFYLVTNMDLFNKVLMHIFNYNNNNNNKIVRGYTGLYVQLNM